MTAKSLYCCLFAWVVLLTAHPILASELFLARDDVRDYIRTVSVERSLDEDRIKHLFTGLSTQQSILDAISRPAERTLTWGEYRSIFITQKRTDLGRKFLLENQLLLERARQTYGVPANIIAAIIGVETFYGRITGKHGVLESLATLAFDYPPRSGFFRSELTEFLVLSELEGWEATSVKGSYAGAMGLPQFISSSYRQYAVDFDGDGKRDLFNSTADVIGSVANYLASHGWVEGAPIAAAWPLQAQVPAAVRALVRQSLLPVVSGNTVKKLGFASSTLDSGTEKERLLSVMIFNAAESDEVWVGYRNFYAITRYNHSQMYAMAVFQLATALQNSQSKSSPSAVDASDQSHGHFSIHSLTNSSS